MTPFAVQPKYFRDGILSHLQLQNGPTFTLLALCTDHQTGISHNERGPYRLVELVVKMQLFFWYYQGVRSSNMAQLQRIFVYTSVATTVNEFVIFYNLHRLT
jgi:hypothetical protein